MRSLMMLLVVMGLAVFTPAFAQEAKPVSEPGGSQPEAPATVLRATTRMVVLDVVATDKHGKPVTDLKAGDFTVLDKGRQQEIKAFEFQQPARGPAGASVAPAALKLPANVFTNNQFTREPKTLNVILLDAMNTTPMSVRWHMLRFLETMPAGQRVAVYTLNGKLRMLQDFTSDPELLREALKNHKTERSAVPGSPSTGPKDQSLSLEAFANNPLGAGLQESLQRFTDEETGYANCIHFELTAQSLQKIAQTLAGYAGRKNMIWVAGSVPFRFLDDDYQKKPRCWFDSEELLQRTYDALGDAGIAVYPVDAAGLAVFGLDASTSGPSGPARRQSDYGVELSRQSSANAQNHFAMAEMARATGGKAFYDRNDLNTAIKNGITDGSTYYLLGYYPSDKNWDGKFRKVEVKVNRPDINLRHRPGYYAIDKQSDAKDRKARESAVAGALDIANPAATTLLFTAAVTPPSGQTGGKMVVKYNIDPHSILFESGANGLQHADVTCWVRAFNEKGDPLKATSQTSSASLKPDTYQRVLKTAFPCTAEMELPAGKYVLRFAVRDERAGLMGTANGKVTIAEE